MPEWWTYTLSDFLMFSPRVYYRMFELHNAALWPVQLATAGLGIVVLYFMLRPEGNLPRVSVAILGGLWIWVAWSFFGSDMRQSIGRRSISPRLLRCKVCC